MAADWHDQANNKEIFWGELAPSAHLVQIYADDRVFLDTLEGFVAGGLRNGECVVIIATPEHRDELSQRLTAQGFDVNTIVASGQYIAIDAEVTLSKFMVGDWPDGQLFARVVSNILKSARLQRRPVRAFGEMVAILWARGHNAATVHLEHLWHALCDSESFSLFCAYPRSGFTKNASASIQEICEAHSHLVPGGDSPD